MENYQARENIVGIIKELSQPIPPQLLKQKEVKNKKTGEITSLDYIPWYHAVTVLDRVAPGWSYQVKSVQHVGGNVVCIASITIQGVTREATGIEDDDVSGYGDPTSNAESMALRRAASKFGLGLYLYDKKGTSKTTTATSQRPAQQPPVKREGVRTMAAKAQSDLEAKPCRDCNALGAWVKAKGKPVFIDLAPIDASTLASDEFWLKIQGEEGFWKKGPAQEMGFLRHSCKSVPASHQDDDNQPPAYGDDDIPWG